MLEHRLWAFRDVLRELWGEWAPAWAGVTSFCLSALVGLWNWQCGMPGTVTLMWLIFSNTPKSRLSAAATLGQGVLGLHAPSKWVVLLWISYATLTPNPVAVRQHLTISEAFLQNIFKHPRHDSIDNTHRRLNSFLQLDEIARRRRVEAASMAFLVPFPLRNFK